MVLKLALGLSTMLACLLLQALLISAAIAYYRERRGGLAGRSFLATAGVITGVMMLPTCPNSRNPADEHVAAVVMMLIATMTAAFVTTAGRSAWFVGVLVLTVYAVFAMTLYLLPPRAA